jgi:hypothetical protein
MTAKREISPEKKRLLIVLAAAEIIVKLYAAWDLAHRDASELNGPKRLWGPALLINFFGPVAYLGFGRR